MKPAAAAARYLPEMSADERLAVGHLRRVAKAVQSQLEAHGEADQATALMQTAGEGGLAPAATAPSRPSLEEFAATLEADMYSERELVELYEERYGDAPAVVAEDGPGVSRAALVQRALSGIALVQSQDVQAPAGEDGIELWLSERLCRQLRPLGVLKASGNDLPVTQQLLGHKSISTTGIYLKADMGQRIEAVMAMPERFDER